MLFASIAQGSPGSEADLPRLVEPTLPGGFPDRVRGAERDGLTAHNSNTALRSHRKTRRFAAPKQGRFTQAAREERKALQRLLRQQRKLLQVIE